MMHGLFIVGTLVASIAVQDSGMQMRWDRLADIPDAVGLAGPFAGTIGSTLVVGGGANFPDRPPWQGGTKVWHDRVWGLDSLGAKWREIGRLPKPLAYGVSISTGRGLLCVGGSDALQHHSEVFLIELIDGQMKSKSLPPLTRPVANACGALLGTKILIAGGTESPSSTESLHVFLQLDLNEIEKGWTELPPWPGRGRLLAVSAVVGDRFFLISGADLSADAEGKPVRSYLTDAFQFQVQQGWSRIPDIPVASVAAPTPAPVWNSNGFAVIGGDDGSKVGFLPMENHPGFSKSIQLFDTSHNKWSQLGYTPAPRVTVPIVQWNDRWMIVSGEERPGVRSPEVWSCRALQSK